MLPDKAKSVVCSIISLALSFWMKHLVIGQLQKPAQFSAFHWSTSRSQAFISQLLGKYNKAKSVVCSIIILALSFWMKHLVIGQLQNLLNSRLFSGQHLDVRFSLVSFSEPAG